MKSDLVTKNDKDIVKLLIEKEEALKNFRFGVAGSKVRNIKEGRSLKRDIARIKTEISRRNNN